MKLSELTIEQLLNMKTKIENEINKRKIIKEDDGSIIMELIGKDFKTNWIGRIDRNTMKIVEFLKPEEIKEETRKYRLYNGFYQICEDKNKRYITVLNSKIKDGIEM
jgi:hypothetical protein